MQVKYNASIRSEYSYNGLNWRVLKRADTSPDGDLDQQRVMYYNANNSGGWQLVEELINDSWDDEADPEEHTRRMQYVWGARYIDDIVARQQRDPLGTLEPGALVKTWYHLTDTLFSTIAIIDDAATLIERISYDAYGNARHHHRSDLNGDGHVNTSDYLIASGASYNNYGVGDLNRDGIVNNSDIIIIINDWAAALPAGQLSKTDNIIGYAGYIFNAEVHTSGGGGGLYTVRHRHYVPELGRWLTRDPIGYVDGMGLYEYVGSAALVWQDPFGLKRKKKRDGIPYSPGDDTWQPRTEDDCGECPEEDHKVVIILGDTSGPFWDLTPPRWRSRFNKTIDNLTKDGRDVDHYSDGVGREQFKNIIQDPCVVEIIVIGHGSDGDDDAIIWTGPDPQDGVTPADVKRWRGPCRGPGRVRFLSCNQGLPKNRKKWEDAWEIEPSEFFAPRGPVKWWHREPGPGVD